MGLGADDEKKYSGDLVVSSKTMKCQVDANGNILAYGVINGTPWFVNDEEPHNDKKYYFINDKEANPLPFVVAPESNVKLVNWTMKPDFKATKSEPKWVNKYQERRLVFTFTNNNKAPQPPPVVEQMTEIDNGMLERMQKVETVVKEMTEVDNGMLQRMKKVETVVKKMTEKGDESKALIKKKDEQNAQTIKDLRASIENLEEKNKELQKSQDDILLTVQTLQNMVDMMKTSVDSKANAIVDTVDRVINGRPVAQVTVNNTLVENNEQVDETEDEEDTETVAGDTSTAIPMGTLHWDPNETQDEEQTQVFNKMDVDHVQSDDEKQPEKQIPSEDTSQDQDQMEEDDEGAIVFKRKTPLSRSFRALNAEDDAPKKEVESPKKEGEALKVAIEEIVFDILDEKGEKYAEETLKTLWPVVAEKLEGYDKDSQDDKNICRNDIIEAFRVFERKKKNEEQQVYAAVQIKPHTVKTTEKQTRMSMLRADKTEIAKNLLHSWAASASSKHFDEFKTNPHINTVYALLEKNWDEQEKYYPQLAEYKKAADAHNIKYATEIKEAASKKGNKRATGNSSDGQSAKKGKLGGK